MNPSFWQGKRVLLTGHTGFKGSWAALWLTEMGAVVTGVSLNPQTEPNLFSILSPIKNLDSYITDINNLKSVEAIVRKADPQIVIHMAAQALVRRSFKEPLETFSTNIMGTLNLLSALQNHASLKVILVITSDKVYENRNENIAFTETDRLGGDDPYSASKACAEIAVNSWRKSFLSEGKTILATARGGNVIGGGDWSEDRLIPDFVKAVEKEQSFFLRNPTSTRPWQHVLDVLNGYFLYVEKLYEDNSIPLSINLGPSQEDSIPTEQVIAQLKKTLSPNIKIETGDKNPVLEKSHLALDAALAKKILGWQPKFNIGQAIGQTAAWYNAYLQKQDMQEFSLNQIKDF